MYKKIIKEIADELDIKYTLLSKDWVIMLEKNNQIKYITGYKFDINNQAASLCVDDKYATYEILKNKSIPVIEHNILYDETNNADYASDCHDRVIAFNYFKEHDNNIVIKGNNGTCGREVYHITKESDITDALNNLFPANHSVSLCPFYNIEKEYRIIILNHEPKIIYSKSRPIVYGDGINTISTLLHNFNPKYHYKITEDRVLAKDEKYEYTWTHNLSNGSTIDMNIDNNTKELLTNMAINISNILNLNFGSIDIIKVDNKYLVLECNSGVMMHNLIKILPDGYEIAKNIYKEAIIKMFN